MVCVAAFVEAASMGIISPINSLYAKSFGLNTTSVGIFITSFAVGRVLVSVPAGKLADRFGRKKLLVAGPLLMALSAVGLATAPNFSQLLASRLLNGMGSALFITGALLVIADLSSIDERGRMNSFFQFSTILGLTVAPFIGGLLTMKWGYHVVYYVHASMAFLIGMTNWWFFAESYKKLMPGTNQNSKTNPANRKFALQNSLITLDFIMIALVGFIIFISRSGSRDTLLPLIGTELFGLSPSSIGLLFSFSAIANLMTVPLAGFISDLFGRKPAILIGLFLNSLGLLMIGTTVSYNLFFLGAMLMASGKGFGETTSLIYVADITDSNRYGSTYGLFLTIRDLGLLLGPISLGLIADLTNIKTPPIINGFAMLLIFGLFFTFGKETLHCHRIKYSE